MKNKEVCPGSEGKLDVGTKCSKRNSLAEEELALRCKHGKGIYLCVDCALSAAEIKKWDRYRTKEKHVYAKLCRRTGDNQYIPVMISKKDCNLISRSSQSVPRKKISDWYGCSECHEIIEHVHGTCELTACPYCGGNLFSVGEPFQAHQFCPLIGNGGDSECHRGKSAINESKVSPKTLDLLRDPNSRIQKGGIGYLRTPLDAARTTRKCAPAWFDHRAIFLNTLKKSRALRGERILFGYYVEGLTDEQIAKSIGWKKHAVKKERTVLLRNANRYFLKHPHSPAVGEGKNLRNQPHLQDPFPDAA